MVKTMQLPTSGYQIMPKELPDHNSHQPTPTATVKCHIEQVHDQFSNEEPDDPLLAVQETRLELKFQRHYKGVQEAEEQQIGTNLKWGQMFIFVLLLP